MTDRACASSILQFCRFFIIFLALFVVRHGPAVTSGQLDKVQAGIIFMLLQQVSQLLVLHIHAQGLGQFG